MAVAGVGILPGTMQTAIIRQNRLELTPETAGSVGLDRWRRRAAESSRMDTCVVEPAGCKTLQLLGLHVPLRLGGPGVARVAQRRRCRRRAGWTKARWCAGLPTPTIRHSRPRARTALRCRRTGSYRL